MATLPGLPQGDEPDPGDTLPVEPDDGSGDLGVPPVPGDDPVDLPKG